ncbi:MAG: ASKHA domain-containing protein [Methanomicrobiales archaeon]|nr:ASKHA domain-containing protein [Methanomicrobiales archaeon]
MIILPGGRRGPLETGKTILSHLQQAKAPVTAHCGGRGECRACAIRIDRQDLLSPKTEVEESLLDDPLMRLACQATITGTDGILRVELPRYPRYSIVERGLRPAIPLSPHVELAGKEGSFRVAWGGRVLGPYEGEVFGVALDIGTTTLAMRWMDLEDGKNPDRFSASVLNPQIRFGDNVIDRIRYATQTAGGARHLQGAVIGAVNNLLSCGAARPDHIYEMTVAGNSVMRDLLLGRPVEGLGGFPFEPVSTGSVNTVASDLGIAIHPQGNIYALPLIGHFVGADTLAMILATGMHRKEEVTMAIDIGTNTEIALGNRDGIMVTSCASGPAFEGSGIACGTGSVEGAIQRLAIESGGRVMYETIGNGTPVGICGSGLIDTLAELLEHGIIDWTGKFTGGRERFSFIEGERAVYLDGGDLDNLKLAKAAVAAGAAVLLEHAGIGADSLSRLFLAGAFGTYIDVMNAKRIGMLPGIPPERVVKVGNASIEGAALALLSCDCRKRAEELAGEITHVSLERDPAFQDRFVEELCFLEYRKNERSAAE